MLWHISKVCKQRIGVITSWRLMSDASWTCKIIRNWSDNSFKMFESIRNDLKARTLGVIQVEAKRCWTASCHVWTATSTAKKARFLHCFVTDNKKWIHYNSPKSRRLWDKPGHTSACAAKLNIQGSNLLLCIWWDQLDVVYQEPLKLTKTITGDCYQL